MHCAALIWNPPPPQVWEHSDQSVMIHLNLRSPGLPFPKMVIESVVSSSLLIEVRLKLLI